ncbi:MAG: hypothetical protein JKY82_12505 [Rhizobiaceae bacterium]|nr:hypothetical protein [Rhizobiaceae bacterium]
MANKRGLLIGFGGIGGSFFSRGLKTVGARAVNELGWEFRSYGWESGGAAGREAKSWDGPVVLIWHSAGKAGADDFCEAFGRRVDMAFAVDSWLPGQSPHELIRRVYSIIAGRGGRFHVRGNSVVDWILYPDETHTSIDDEPKLHDFVIKKLGELMNVQNNIPSIPKFDSVLDDLDAGWALFMSPERETEFQQRWQKAFFDGVRGKILKPLTVQQVDGLKTMIFIWRAFFANEPIAFFASVAGQAVRETGGKLVAIRETFARSDAQAIARLENAWASGQLQRFGVRTPYWRDSGHGHAFGRGIIQLSLLPNYSKAEKLLLEKFGVVVDLDGDFSLALDPLVSAIVAFGGCIHGIFRKKKLADYIRTDGSFDFFNARDVVNGDKRKVGSEVEADSKAFLKALEAAEKVAPGFLAGRGGALPTLPVPTAPTTPTIPILPDSAITLDALRQIPSSDLRRAIIASTDKIKLATIILDERDNSPAAFLPPQTEGNDMKFSGIKSFFKSKTILGIVFAAVATLMPASKPLLDIFMPETSGLSPEVVESLLEAAKQTFESLRLLVQASSLAFASYGRVVADTKIK